MSIRSAAACLVLASCLGAQLAVAQMKPGQRPPLSFGVVGGVNLASMSGSDASGSSTRTAFHVGGAAVIPLGTNLFFQPNALYSMKGPKIDFSGGTASLEMNYLEVPLMLGLRIPMQGSGLRPFVMAGPSIGLKVGCKVKASGGGTTASMNCDDPSVGMTVRSTDMAVAFGGGVEVPVGSGLVSIYGRYALGLSEPIENSNVKNNVISVGLGYFFGHR